ncbi:hypothetical protein Poly24_03470 [Rosistilla carotiformis]|uniref:LssY-like C-terminal domain-containing protein n=1 Tax=Rosistilla carotiformis TaxID=2528017 RepID=A0A518JM75_9BACT|nr:hypothetical protein Poly24_03470 [Rosistilla carotiformis]
MNQPGRTTLRPADPQPINRHTMDTEPETNKRKPHGRTKWLTKVIVASLLLWLAVAYLAAPWAWELYIRRHQDLDDQPRITRTSDGHPGDPLNVELIGSEAQLQQIMKAADWYSAAALGLKSDLKIAADTVLSRPDDAAPVSSLYLFGRKEDLAFEQPVGDNPRHRHHVRLWKTDEVNPEGRPKWLGSAVYDKRVGLSHTTGQITHVTAADIDAERDYLFQCLEQTGQLAEHSIEPNFHQQHDGYNGGGDPWHTDGSLYIGVIRATEP